MSQKEKSPGVGVGVMILKAGKVLLGLRHYDPKKADSELHGEGTWTMPGGKLHFYEHPLAAAQREVYEEIGVKIKQSQLALVSVTSDLAQDAHFITLGFSCKNFQGEPKVKEPEEITQWHWFALNKIPKNIFPPSKKILQNYSNHKNKF